MERVYEQYQGPDNRFLQGAGDYGEIYAKKCSEKMTKDCLNGFSARLNIPGPFLKTFYR